MKLQYRLFHVVIIVGVLCLVGCRRQDNSDVESTYDVVITEIADGRKILAIKGVREVTGLGLKDAKDLVESMPSVVKEGLSKTEADEIAAKLKESSLVVEVRPH
ncbi:MAG: bL12 family ribosomal protein [Planctomycetota bacterium]|jgi:large subunit ribosomal protein L7/L12